MINNLSPSQVMGPRMETPRQPNLAIFTKMSKIDLQDSAATQGALLLIRECARTKHIDVRVHFIRDYIREGIVDVGWVDTHNQRADFYTKPLSRAQHEFMRSLSMGAVSPPRNPATSSTRGEYSDMNSNLRDFPKKGHKKVLKSNEQLKEGAHDLSKFPLNDQRKLAQNIAAAPTKIRRHSKLE